MEEDILNYSPTDMVRGTPCIFDYKIWVSDKDYPLEVSL